MEVSQYLSGLEPIALHDLNWKARKVLLIQADVKRASGSQPISASNQRSLRRLTIKQLGVVANLFAIPGALYMNLRNDDVVKKIANGTISLQSVVLHPGAHIRIVACGENDDMLVHAVYATEVEALIFKHHVKSFQKEPFFPSLDVGCFPTRQISITRTINLNGTPFKAKLNQFNTVLAVVTTGHKMQGQSLDFVTLGDLMGTHTFGTTGWLYVVTSRARTLAGFFTLQKLSPDLNRYKPRTAIINEMKRLRTIGQDTPYAHWICI